MTTSIDPLGLFGPTSREGFELSSDMLAPLQGALETPLRGRVAAYLRSGTVVLALMEYTTDVIGGQFGVSGGSAILTDGAYYWRADAAEYVEYYAIGIEPSALRWMEKNGWCAPKPPDAELEAIDSLLHDRLSRK